MGVEMQLKVTEEIKQQVVQQVCHPGESINAVAYGTLMDNSLGVMILGTYFGAIGAAITASYHRYGFIIATNEGIRVVSLNSMNTSTIKEVYEIPYSEMTKVKYVKGSFKSHFVKFNYGKQKYKLVLREKAGRSIQNQKENVQYMVQMLTNLQASQKVA